VLTRAAVSSVLIGASSAKQLQDNLGAAEVKLTADDLSALDAATKPTSPYPNWFTDRVADGKVSAALGIPLATPLCVGFVATLVNSRCDRHRSGSRRAFH
jgi:hypothetical protein